MEAEPRSFFRVAKRPMRVWSIADRVKLAEMWGEGAPIALIADEFDRSEHQIYAKAHQMGLPRRKQRGGGRKPAAKRGPGRPPKNGVAAKKKGDRSGQRRFLGVENSSGPKITLEPHDPRYRNGATVFPTMVIPAARMPRLIKSGINSRKIGETVTKGRWKGQSIFTLTLEERATCPRSCKEWATCYGNNMNWAQRIHDDGTLTQRLWGELAMLNAAHPDGFVVRLHVLGDFKSIEYVEFWRQALIDFPALNVFGFTARIPPDPIGNALVKVVADNYERFRIRFSGAGFETDCSEVVDKPEDATGVLCPAESDPNRCCATCALCMQSNITISFVRH